MTEEEYFRKNYPDFCYGDRPLSPYWDFFQEGVEFGEQQSEKKIAELEKKNAELKLELTKATEIISEWEDSFCCGADYLYLGNKGRELRIKSQKFLNSEIEK